MRKRPWKAAGLSLLLAGLGQLYAGAPIRAGLMVVLDTFLAVAAILGFLFLPSWNLAPLAGYVLVRGLVCWDAVRCVRRRPEPHRLPAWLRWPVYALVVWSVGSVGFGLVAERLHRYALQGFRVRNRDMADLLLPGDRVLVNRLPFAAPRRVRELLGVDASLHRGDVIFWRGQDADLSAKIYVHRVIAFPGETIEVRDGRAYVDGRRLDEPYLLLEGKERARFGPWKIPANRLFLLGDRRHQAIDSRSFPSGLARVTAIVGRAHRVAFSRSPEDGIRWRRIGMPVR